MSRGDRRSSWVNRDRRDASLERSKPKVVHFMRYGTTACGLLAGDQNNWSVNTFWVTFGDEKDVKGCAVCVAEAQLAEKVKK